MSNPYLPPDKQKADEVPPEEDEEDLSNPDGSITLSSKTVPKILKRFYKKMTK